MGTEALGTGCRQANTWAPCWAMSSKSFVSNLRVLYLCHLTASMGRHAVYFDVIQRSPSADFAKRSLLFLKFISKQATDGTPSGKFEKNLLQEIITRENSVAGGQHCS